VDTEQPVTRARRSRSIIAWVLVVVVSILLPLSVMTVWAVNIVTNTNKYVETMAPIASNPTVIANTSMRVTNEFFSSADVQKRITNVLPKKASALAVPLTDGLHSTVQNQVQKILSSSFFQKVWNNGNRRAHQTLVNTLSGKNSKTTRTLKNGNEVVINISSVADKAIEQLDTKGITVFNPLKQVFASKNGTLTVSVVSSDQVKKATGLFNVVQKLKWWIPLAALILAVAAVAVAVRRRKTLLRMALGGSIAVVVFLIALALARNDFVSTAMKKSLNGQTAGIIFDTLLRYLKDGLWITLAVLLVLSVVLWFVGRRGGRPRTADLAPTVGSLPAEETKSS
jgi:hypothetical protein